MRRRATALLCAGAVLLASAAEPLALERARLAAAREAARAASERAAVLDRQAEAARDAAVRARAQEAAVVARITRAEAEIAAARARVAIVGELLARQRAALGERQAPVARLVAALIAMARRPAAAAIVQPGSVADLVHVRAVLGSALPVVREQTAALRDDLGRTRALQADAALAAAALDGGRRTLVRERQALAALQARHAAAAAQLGRDALAQSDRAIALGEAARDIVDRMAAIGATAATLDQLAPLAGPPGFDPVPAAVAPAYRLPVEGRLMTGFGEISANGVRARGLTFTVAPRAPVVAPAAGKVLFARPFRRFGTIVILDHGLGWTSLVTGLADAVPRGVSVSAGQPIGRAPDTDGAEVMVELRRHGRPVDIAALVA